MSQVEVRAESQQNLDLLAETFVDPGVTDQLENNNSQIVYGRRGTGKTHILKFIEQGLRQQRSEGCLGIYMDMRILGSGSLNVTAGREPYVRTTVILRDILERIHAELMAHVTDPGVEVEAGAFEALNGLVTAMQRTVLHEEEIATESSDSDARESSGGAGIVIKERPEIRLDSGHSKSRQRQSTVSRSGKPQQALYYQEVGNALNAALDCCGITHLTLLLDEWTSIPMELQPLLADYLRRCFLAHPRMCLKIASIRHRSQFHGSVDGNPIGFEMGADVAATLELDEHFVFERNRARSMRLFAELLHRHLSIEASLQASASDYLRSTYGVAEASEVNRLSLHGRSCLYRACPCR